MTDLTQDQLQKLLKEHEAVDKWWRGLTLKDKQNIRGGSPTPKPPSGSIKDKPYPTRKPPTSVDYPMESGKGPPPEN